MKWERWSGKIVQKANSEGSNFPRNETSWVRTTFISETDLEAHQTFKIKLFDEIVNASKSLAIFAKSTILDVWRGSKSSSDLLCT